MLFLLWNKQGLELVSTDNIIVDPMCDPRHAQHAGLINQYVPSTNVTPAKDTSYPHGALPRVPKAHRYWT